MEMRVGLFDSGIGGINVLKELIIKYPNNHYIYYGDTKNLPYGNKSKEELIKLSENIINFLLEKKVDIIIIACGTVSSNCYSDLLKKYQIPIYNIISPTIDYLKRSKYQKIGVIGTTKTIESRVFNLPDKNILMKETPDFVPIIENNLLIDKEDLIVNSLSVFNDYEILVLGCTHYPLLENIINKHFNFKLIDMGKCLTNYINLNGNDELVVDLYFSKINDIICNNINNILNDLCFNLVDLEK